MASSTSTSSPTLTSSQSDSSATSTSSFTGTTSSSTQLSTTSGSTSISSSGTATLTSSQSQSLTTTASASPSSGSSSVTGIGSSAPSSTGGESSPIFSTASSTIRSSSQSLTRTSSAAAPSTSSTGVVGTTSSGGSARRSSHIFTLLSILLPLLFFLLLLGIIYLCRRKQLKRGMNIFGQRLELGETPGAWRKLSEAGGSSEKQKDIIPGNSEKRSMLTVAASVLGRVGLPANLHEPGIKGGGSPSTAQHAYMPTGRRNRSGGNDDSESLREARIPFGTATSSKHVSVSSLDPYPSPPLSHSSRSHSSSLLPYLPFTFHQSSSTSSEGDVMPVQDVPITASHTGSNISHEGAYFDGSRSRLDFDLDLGLEVQLQSDSQRGFIPIMRTDTLDSTISDFSDAEAGMGYISVTHRNSMPDSDSRNEFEAVPGTLSLATHTLDPGIVSPQTENEAENASQHSQDSRNTQDTQDTYETQGSMGTSSSLLFARPTMIPGTTSSGDGTGEIPLITPTFHYAPHDDDDDDDAGSSGGSLSLNNPFHLFHHTQSSRSFQQLPTTGTSSSKEAEADFFFRNMAWRRRAAAYTDSTGQRPSLMEAVEAYFASSTDSGALHL
ncbi:hypothetical protein BT96DRAFT_420389 [Gymnopus androsaceus JB14]|uniref:Uncharacterized protein n=1 Tax=Gymnopus androsaceus JB14 TaxID=1447944 RepID=A0A6A4I6T6_9AGAR|nr:hypothetical protein BT96DRAFT_420389 [Gymnopus androsaceus JB14]